MKKARSIIGTKNNESEAVPSMASGAEITKLSAAATLKEEGKDLHVEDFVKKKKIHQTK